MISTNSTLISSLDPMDCIKQEECSYNKWLISIQQDTSKKILFKSEKQLIINYHTELQELRASLQSKEVDPSSFFYQPMADGIDINACAKSVRNLEISKFSVEFLDAFMSHLHELLPQDKQHCLQAEVFLQSCIHRINNLKTALISQSEDARFVTKKNIATEEKKAKAWIHYMQTTDKKISPHLKHDCIYYALVAKSYKILDSLLNIKDAYDRLYTDDVNPLYKFGGYGPDARDEQKSIREFMQSNHDIDLKIAIMLKLYMYSKYLYLSEIHAFTVLFNDNDRAYMFEVITNITELIELDKSKKSIIDSIVARENNPFDLSYLATSTFAKHIVEHHDITLLDKYSMSYSEIMLIKVLYYKYKFCLNLYDDKKNIAKKLDKLATSYLFRNQMKRCREMLSLKIS
jgi:hypothetical protein